MIDREEDCEGRGRFEVENHCSISCSLENEGLGLGEFLVLVLLFRCFALTLISCWVFQYDLRIISDQVLF